MENKHLHSGHRQRLRDKFIKNGGIEGFADHEVVEMLLYYALPRRDVNELAHKICNEFGSLSKLFAATPEEIEKRCNVTENTAVLISLVHHISKRYLTEGAIYEKQKINSKQAAFEVVMPYFTGVTSERIYLVCLNLQLELINVELVSRGGTQKATVDMQRLISVAIENKAVFAIVAHNHPGGNLAPSNEDISATVAIKKALRLVNINLIDHLIVGNGRCYSFAQNNLFGMSYEDK